MSEHDRDRQNGPSGGAGGPLSGIVVADFTAAFAGPLATLALADLGAEVIKIEPVEVGDMARDVSPWIFIAVNRNKRSVAIDLKTDQGRRLARELALSADVVAASSRPGVMESFGLDADSLRRERPDLIYASLSGYGLTGPKARQRSMDLIIKAESGMVATGTGANRIALVDFAAGMAVGQAILAALFQRERTGVGAVVEGRLFDAGVFLQATTIAEYTSTGRLPTETEGIASTGVFQTLDAPLCIAAYYERDWRLLCTVLGLQDVADDPRFGSRELRQQHKTEVRDLLQRQFATADRAHWLAALADAGVMSAPVQTLAEMFEDPQIVGNQVLAEPLRAVPGASKQVRPPYTIDGQAVPVHADPPIHGADTVAVLQRLGHSEDDIDQWMRSGVVASGD